jgi:outer membrane protein TolC
VRKTFDIPEIARNHPGKQLDCLLAGCAAGPTMYAPRCTSAADADTRPVATSLPGAPLAASAASGGRLWQRRAGRHGARGLEQSPSIEAAQATLRAAHQNVVAQRGYFLPSIQLGYNPTRQNTGQSCRRR